ncbi:DUF4855 domain-containing protein [Brevibacillus laterosporus]|uniref:hypothetical protein n=1 Tax=Brevibacillus laterosporus TaxID=1465 RepID=UPI002E1D76EB|nr:DUF4855 domain-containing protein [Brevibacillus laterosporus]
MASIRGLHVYTGEGYNTLTVDILDEVKSNTNMNKLVLHLANSSQVRFEYGNSKNKPVDATAQCISALKKFLPLWEDSDMTANRMWIALPYLHNNGTTYNNAKDLYADYKDFMQKVKSAVLSTLGETTWNNYVEGFYFSTETVMPIQSKISSTTPTSNSMVKLMNDISAYIRSTLDKKFLWCPYYGFGQYADNITYNLGVIANRTNIFDHIFIQPAYYFQAGNNCTSDNLTAVYRSAKFNEVEDLRGNSIAGGRKSNATATIGVNMEANDNAVRPSTPESRRFQEYIDQYQDLVRGTPMVFYAGATDNLSRNTTLSQKIGKFYK